MNEFATQLGAGVAVNIATSIASWSWSKLTGELFDEMHENTIEILNTKTGQEAARIAVDYMKKTNGIPNEDVWSLIKLMLLKAWNEGDDNEQTNEQLQFAQRASTLTPNEVLVLIAAYKLGMNIPPDINTRFPGGGLRVVVGWEQLILERSSLPWKVLVIEAREGLQNKSLIVAPTLAKTGLFKGGAEKQGNLTDFGYAMMDSAYEEMKSVLD